MLYNNYNQEIAIKAKAVAHYLHNKEAKKKHGGFHIYHDDKIYICLDTYVANIFVDVVLPDGERECVLACGYSSYGHPHKYHRGKWEKYLDILYKKAMEKKKDLDIEKQIQRDKCIEEKFKPASNEAEEVFADI
jgi:DNA-binding sugar fermentation-stimulating protein